MFVSSQDRETDQTAPTLHGTHAQGAQLARGTKPLEVLLIACFDGRNAQTITDHVEALERHSRHRVLVYNHYPALAHGLRYPPSTLRLSRFDVVVIHYSMYLLDESIDYLDAGAKREIAGFKGVKVMFRQDEYNHVDGLITILQQLKVDVLFTNFPPGESQRVYREDRLPGLRLESNLTGYVSESFLARKAQPLAGRPIDVGYRSRELPYWLGALGAEKILIATEFQRRTQGLGLVNDISVRESDRIYGERWPQFLADCKAVLGTESGASVIDFTGEVRRCCDQYVQEHPEASFEEVQALYFKDLEGIYHLEQISPRCFEAACLGTAMILFEGRYSGILEPWRHFVPLKKDFSNLDQVVAALRDVDRLQAMVDRTRLEIACNPAYSFRNFVNGFDRTLDEAFAHKGVAAVSEPYSRESFERASGRLLASHSGFAPIRPVTIQSRLVTEPSHPFSNVLPGAATDAGAIVRVGQPLPHEFILSLPRTFALQRISLAWLSADERALDFDVELMTRTAVVKSFSIRNNALARVDLDIDGIPCRRVRVRVLRCSGEQRLMLRSVEAYGSWRPLGNSKLRPLMRGAWLLLPQRIRGRSRIFLNDAAALLDRMVWSPGVGLAGHSRSRGPVPLRLRARTGLKFYPGHGIENALSTDSNGTYVAAVEGQPLPHEFQIVLSHLVRAGRFTILWESPENLATRFTITACSRGEERMRIEIEESTRHEVTVDFNDVECDCLRVAIHAYHGQQRLLLRRIALEEISASTPHADLPSATAAAPGEPMAPGTAGEARP